MTKYTRLDFVNAAKTGPVPLIGKHTIFEHPTTNDSLYEIGCFIEMSTLGGKSTTGIAFFLDNNTLHPHIIDLSKIKNGTSQFKILGNGEALRIEFDSKEEMLVNYLYSDVLEIELN